MKRWGIIIAVTAFVIYGAFELVHDFIANDPIGYFSEQPSRLLLVAGIAVTGGLVALTYSRLSPRAQRGAKLFAIGAMAVGWAVFTTLILCMSFRVASLYGYDAVRGHLALIAGFLAFSGTIAALLWFAFYRVFKKRDV